MRKLTAAIEGDITAFQNEQAETMARAAGYWRYVNKRTYNIMVRNNTIWDWATGEKLPELDIGDEDCVEDDEHTLVDDPPTKHQHQGHGFDPSINSLDDVLDSNISLQIGEGNKDASLSPKAVKDDRNFTRAIRQASPPKLDAGHKSSSAFAVHRPLTFPEEEKNQQVAEYSNNMYETLHVEVPAPREEPLPPQVCPIPKTRKVKKSSPARTDDFPALVSPSPFQRGGFVRKAPVPRITSLEDTSPRSSPSKVLPRLGPVRKDKGLKRPIVPPHSAMTKSQPVSWAAAVKGLKKE